MVKVYVRLRGGGCPGNHGAISAAVVLGQRADLAVMALRSLVNDQ